MLAFSLPIGLLTAALLAVRALPARTRGIKRAARASGLSLVSLITPVLLLSVIVSGLCAWLNFDIAPSCRTAYRGLLFTAQTNRPANALRSGELVPLGDYNVWVGKVDEDGTNLHHVIVVAMDADG